MKWMWPLALIAIFGIGEREIWRRHMAVSGIAGDAAQYYQLAHSLSRGGGFSFDDGVTREWTRLPGYPLLLAALVVGSDDDFAGWFRRTQWLNLGLDVALAGLVLLIAHALGAGKWAWAGAAAWVLQPWSTLCSTIPLTDVCAVFFSTACLVALLWAMRGADWRRYALPGALAAAAQYVRGDAVLLLPVLLLGALLARAQSRGARWRSAALALGMYTLVYAPWPARNLARFGTPHWVGGGTNIDGRGAYFDRAAVMAWMNTWATDERATIDVAWRIPLRPLTLLDLPREAIDTPQEAIALRGILSHYNALGGQLDEGLRGSLSQLAAARARRHPLRSWVLLPLWRMAKALFPPRDGYGLGPLPALVLLRPLYVAGDAFLTVAALWALALLLLRRQAEALLLGAFVGLRLLLMARMPTGEPRYFLPALPLLYAFAATLPALIKTLPAKNLPIPTLPAPPLAARPV